MTIILWVNKTFGCIKQSRKVRATIILQNVFTVPSHPLKDKISSLDTQFLTVGKQNKEVNLKTFIYDSVRFTNYS